jgi:hypothetical protein
LAGLELARQVILKWVHLVDGVRVDG